LEQLRDFMRSRRCHRTSRSCRRKLALMLPQQF
jgi:hypothetical protein